MNLTARARLALLLLTACGPIGCQKNTVTDPSGVGSLAWMAGSWRSTTTHQTGTTISEEHWTAPVGGTMFGVGRTFTDNRTLFFEFLRIETTDGDAFYIAHPKARSPGTPFRLIEQSAGRAVFENPEHDFPQRIIYERHGRSMSARIEGVDNGQPHSETWTWQRTGDGFPYSII